MNEYIRGVNLGGWLVLEKWMTPRLFAGIDADDEYTFMKNPNAVKRIERHRQTFITEQDFKWLSEHGVNLVRIPVGYWLFEHADGYTPTVQYLDSAMRWAEQYGIKVLIDLHGAQGSQNGKNHSGKIGKSGWFSHSSYQTATTDLLCQIAARYRDSPVLWGIELLNEPDSNGHYFSLLWFYRRTYRQLCRILKPGTKVVFHDGFHPILFAGSLRRRKSHPVLMDVHWYAFSGKGANPQKLIKRLSRWRSWTLKYAQLFQPVIAGEWSGVFPEKYYKDISANQRKELMRRNIEMQLGVFSKATGWIFWNYKIDGGDEWSYRALIEKGVIK